MAEELYSFYRGASGFALCIAGLSVLLAKHSEKPKKPTGLIFLSTGFLFTLSALDPVINFAADVSNALLITAIYALSQSLMELSIYLLGGEEHAGSKKKTYLFGGIWSLTLFIFPLFDALLDLKPIRISVEDGKPYGPLHSLASILIYAWPLFITVLSFTLARGKIRDASLHSKGIRILAQGLAALLAILVIAVIGLIQGNRALYSLSHTLLQTFMLVWFLFQTRHPEYYLRVRKSIAEERKRRLLLSPEEIRIIGDKMETLLHERLPLDERADIAFLAKKIGVKPFRFSAYINDHLGLSFPDWLNDLRIKEVCRLMKEHPDRTILEIAFECGYGSKTTFNARFLKHTGYSPSEYKKKYCFAKPNEGQV